MINRLHDTHIRVVRIKGLALSRVWWPGSFDAVIERLCSQCIKCAQNSKIQPSNYYYCETFFQVAATNLHQLRLNVL